MANIYIPYGTVEGQTAQIADYIAELIRAHGHQADTADLKRSGDTLPPGYDGVIVAASVHMGKHEGHVKDFVKKNRAELERLQSALVSVSLAAHGDEESAEGYVAKFEEETGWRPAHVGLFAGALLYTHYGFIKKHVMKKIASDKGSPDTDTTRDYVYTEWDGVQRFTEGFLARLAAPSGRA
ncbi:protoporphyrinogen oxidase [Arthrobacter sp. NicSoilB4]|uniref:flavodoxin domain-containing protein n=1 Tax=Arthrobacter sp. NicSoilB4 TaxID=2830997 RepID=UPI001CC7AB2F|nr:flavodoxin domain-containing protein [Arthrobacter sp. NicSoilB4]BCW66269.1 protoporphyrinogen oxidase [Arthrobacter sp. NicSoilB4]